jgi:putative acetyltransferase
LSRPGTAECTALTGRRGISLAIIRQEQPGDAPQIREINRQAFGGTTEADIVDALREACPQYFSLVAQMKTQLIGHILFTPVTVPTGGREATGMGLAPMAVLPEYQRQGIGSNLVRRGVEMVKEAGHPFIVVLGHPTYYPRFRFERASGYGLTCEYDGVPDEAFMVLVLEKAAVRDVAGTVKFRPEFAAAT